MTLESDPRSQSEEDSKGYFCLASGSSRNGGCGLRRHRVHRIWIEQRGLAPHFVFDVFYCLSSWLTSVGIRPRFRATSMRRACSVWMAIYALVRACCSWWIWRWIKYWQQWPIHTLWSFSKHWVLLSLWLEFFGVDGVFFDWQISCFPPYNLLRTQAYRPLSQKIPRLAGEG